MRNLFLRILLVSILLFASVTLISYFVSHEAALSEFKLGYPFIFYEQFQMSGNDFINSGWNPISAIYDYLGAFILTIVGFLLRKLYTKKYGLE